MAVRGDRIAMGCWHCCGRDSRRRVSTGAGDGPHLTPEKANVGINLTVAAPAAELPRDRYVIAAQSIGPNREIRITRRPECRNVHVLVIIECREHAGSGAYQPGAAAFGFEAYRAQREVGVGNYGGRNISCAT